MKDKEVKKLIDSEKKRQKSVINLIASENIASKDSLEALASPSVNKYAEGYIKARYYGGNEVSDKIEMLCKSRALKLFGLPSNKWAVNVQALSGSPANLATYLALVAPGEKIMGMAISDGGHLTHGSKISATGKFWQSIQYGVDPKTEMIDYKIVENIARKEKPKVVVAGFTAYPRLVDYKKFRKIADACGAYLVVDMSHTAGLVAGKVVPSPFPYADVVTTTTHKTLRGPRGALIFSKIDKRDLPKKIDRAVFPGLQGGPHLNYIAGVAVALKEADTKEFRKYAKQIIKNAQVLANELKSLGWKIISGGTDTHLLLVDTFKNGISGKDASDKLEKAGIIVNKNTIPGETRSPMDPSGIRLGTAAETTRGKKEKDMKTIARKIDRILRG